MSIIQAFKVEARRTPVSLAQKLAQRSFAGPLFSVTDTIGHIANQVGLSYRHFEIRRRANVLFGLQEVLRGRANYSQLFPSSRVSFVSMKHLVDAYDAFLVDLWGTVMFSKGVVSGAIETLNYMDQQGKRVLFISNTSDRFSQGIAEELKEVGLNVNDEQIITSGMMLKSFLVKTGIKVKKAAFFGNPATRYYVDKAGLEPLPLFRSKDASLIIVGYWGEECIRKDLEELFQTIRLRDVPILILNPDRFGPKTSRSFYIGTGSIGTLIGSFVKDLNLKREIYWLGKPFPYMYEYSFGLLSGIPKNKILTIGDSLPYDITGGNKVGIDSLLVLSGVHGMKHERGKLQERMINKGIFPTYVLPSIKV